MASMLIACGKKASEENSSTPSQAATAAPTASPAESAAAEAATRIYKDTFGHEVTIPTHPERIVVDQFMGHVLALGIKPVGAASYQFDASFLKEAAAGVEDVGKPVSLEKVLNLKPDLIILQDGGEAVKSYDEFAKIAPTIVLDYGNEKSKNVLDQLTEIGDIVGKQQEAADWIAKYEAKAKLYKEQISAAVGTDVTFSLVEAWAKQTIIYGENFGRGGFNLYGTLQLKPPAIVQSEMLDKNIHWFEASQEVLAKYVGDYIFLTINAGENSKAREEEFKNSAIWKSLPAVKNNRAFTVNSGEFSPGDPISVDKQLDIQVKLILDSIKK
ncbi:unnamed protein product [Aphanomyces euteiches]